MIAAVLLLAVWLMSERLHQITGTPPLKYVLSPCFRIKPVFYASGKSHARVSEEQSYDGPSTSSAHSVPSSGSTFSSYDPRKPPVKSKYQAQDVRGLL